MTDLLNQNVPLEDVQYLAGHSNPRTTQICDRRRVTRNVVERIPSDGEGTCLCAGKGENKLLV